MNKNIQLHGGGKSERAFIHIRDVVSAILFSIKNFKKLKKIQPKTVNEIINLDNYLHTKITKLIYK